MASGCIMGDCPVCGELIWEDEWECVDNVIIHTRCHNQYYKNTVKINDYQLSKLYEISSLKKEIAEVKKIFQDFLEFGNEQIKQLENQLSEIEKEN